MGIELLKDNIDYEQVLGQNTSDTVVKEEYIIPDTQPDVKEILLIDANPKINNIDIMQDKVFVEGSIEFNILYMGAGDENSQLCGVTYSSKFSNYIDVAGAEHEMLCRGNAYVEHMNCSIVNERKIGVEGIVELSAQVEKQHKIEMIGDVLGIGEVQFLRKQTQIDKIVNKSSIDLIAKSNMIIPMDKPQIDEVLKYSINIHKRQVKVLEGKVQVDAFAYIEVLYRDKDSRDINHLADDILITGEENVEEADSSMDYDCDFKVDTSELTIREDDLGEKRIISVDSLVQCNIRLIKKEDMPVIDDAYSPQTNLQLQRQNCDVNMIFSHSSSEAMAKENMELPQGAPQPSEIVMASGKVLITDKKIVENKVVVDGVVNASVIYKTSDPDKYIYALNDDIPFSSTVDAPGCKIDMGCAANAYIENIEASIEAGTILVKSIVALDVKVTYNENKEFIVDVASVEGETPKKRASITIYVVQKGDSLWKVAKRYCTTVESIVKTNNLDNADEILAGKKLLIPGRMLI